MLNMQLFKQVTNNCNSDNSHCPTPFHVLRVERVSVRGAVKGISACGIEVVKQRQIIIMMIMIVQHRFKCILTLYSPASGSSCYIVDIQQIPAQLCSQPSPLSCLGQTP